MSGSAHHVDLLVQRAGDTSFSSSQREALQDPALPTRVLKRVLLGVDVVTIEWALENPAITSHLINAVLRTIFIDRGWNPASPVRTDDGGEVAPWMSGSTVAAPEILRTEILLRDSRVNAKMLRAAWTSGEPVWEGAAARAPAIPANLAAEVLRSGRAELRSVIVRNRSVPQRVLNAHDWSQETRAWTLDMAIRSVRPSARAAMFARLDELGHPAIWMDDLTAEYSVDTAQVAAMCRHDRPAVRRLAAANPLATEEDKVMVALLAPET